MPLCHGVYWSPMLWVHNLLAAKGHSNSADKPQLPPRFSNNPPLTKHPHLLQRAEINIAHVEKEIACWETPGFGSSPALPRLHRLLPPVLARSDLDGSALLRLTIATSVCASAISAMLATCRALSACVLTRARLHRLPDDGSIPVCCAMRCAAKKLHPHHAGRLMLPPHMFARPGCLLRGAQPRLHEWPSSASASMIMGLSIPPSTLGNVDDTVWNARLRNATAVVRCRFSRSLSKWPMPAVGGCVYSNMTGARMLGDTPMRLPSLQVSTLGCMHGWYHTAVLEGACITQSPSLKASGKACTVAFTCHSVVKHALSKLSLWPMLGAPGCLPAKWRRFALLRLDLRPCSSELHAKSNARLPGFLHV